MKSIELKQVNKLNSQDQVIANIVFIHGLNGDINKTWGDVNSDSYWPKTLAEDLNKTLPVNVFSLGYPSELFTWIFNNSDLTIDDRALSLLSKLVSNGITDRPTIFICHSLGGIMLKWMLKTAEESKESFDVLLTSTKLVLFLGTPHKGSIISDQGTFFLKLIPVIKASKFTKDLRLNSPLLQNCFDWYKDKSKLYDIDTYAYRETKTKFGQIIVSKESSNPETNKNSAIPIDADHNEMSKPKGGTTFYNDYLRPIHNCILHLPFSQLTYYSQLDIGENFQKIIELEEKRMDATKKIIQPLEKALGRTDKVNSKDYYKSSRGILSLKDILNLPKWIEIGSEDSDFDLDRITLYQYHRYKIGINYDDKLKFVSDEYQRIKPIESESSFSLIPLFYSLKTCRELLRNREIKLNPTNINDLNSIYEFINRKIKDEKWDIDITRESRNAIEEIIELAKGNYH